MRRLDRIVHIIMPHIHTFRKNEKWPARTRRSSTGEKNTKEYYNIGHVENTRFTCPYNYRNDRYSANRKMNSKKCTRSRKCVVFVFCSVRTRIIFRLLCCATGMGVVSRKSFVLWFIEDFIADKSVNVNLLIVMII